MIRSLLVVMLLGWQTFAWAGEATALYSDPATDARLATLTADLRCLVCQNQSIADSHAELAADLRQEILDLIAAGKSDQEIIDFMVARYGDFVLYKPPMRAATVLLWLGPALLFALAAFGLYRYFKRAPTEDET